MTLSQTYISRKQLLVDNLVAKGVTGYTVNDGLTTLINAVLEIQGGGVRTLTLTSDKDILSYADSESATLTATLLEDGVGVSGATVEFFNGSTSLGTAQTDSNGVAVKTYASTGAGDVSLKAEADNGMIVSKTYSISDIYYYDSLTVDKSRYTTVSGSPTLTYSSNGLNVNTSVTQVALVKNNFLTLPSDYEAELTITYAPSTSEGGGICFDDWLFDCGSTGLNVGSTYKLSNTSRLSANIQRAVTDDVVKVIKTGTTIKLYINDSLITTNTISDDNHLQQFRTYRNRSMTFKDLKIKAL